MDDTHVIDMSRRISSKCCVATSKHPMALERVASHIKVAYPPSLIVVAAMGMCKQINESANINF